MSPTRFLPVCRVRRRRGLPIPAPPRRSGGRRRRERVFPHRRHRDHRDGRRRSAGSEAQKGLVPGRAAEAPARPRQPGVLGNRAPPTASASSAWAASGVFWAPDRGAVARAGRDPDRAARRGSERRVPTGVVGAVPQMGTVFSGSASGWPAHGRAAVDRRGSVEGEQLREGGPPPPRRRAGVNFIGNIEGHLVATDAVDVVVTDGFSGNVVLKTLEGGLEVIVSVIEPGSSRLPRRVLGRRAGAGARAPLRLHGT